jgi:hypothetical protein
MNKEFVPYEESLALKELGFDEPCFGYYGENQELIWKSGYAPWVNSERNLVDNHFATAPTFSQAFRWLYKQLGRDGFGVMPIDTDKCNEELRKLIEIVKNK